MVCFAKKVDQIIKESLVRSIFLPDKHALYSADQRIIQNLLLSVVFGVTYNAGRFSYRTAPCGLAKAVRVWLIFLTTHNIFGP